MVSPIGCFFISPLSFLLLYVHGTINGRLVSSYVSSFIFVNYLCTYVIYLFAGANEVERERERASGFVILLGGVISLVVRKSRRESETAVRKR